MTHDSIIAFRDALRDGDTAGAVDEFDEFDDALAVQADRESAVRDVARAVMSSAPAGSPEVEAAQDFLHAVFRSQQSRIECKQDFALHLTGGPDAQHVADRVDSLAEAVDDVSTAADAIRDRANTDVVGPVVRVSTPSTVRTPAGATVSFDATVTNVGLDAATDRSVEVDGYDLDPQPDTMETLPAGESMTVSLTGEASEPGQSTVTTRVGEHSAQTALSVLTTDDYLEQSLSLIEALDEQTAEFLDDEESGNSNGNRGEGGGNHRGLRKKLETATKRIERIRARLDGRGSRSVDEKIMAVTELLGAYVNQVEGTTPRTFTDRQHAILTGDASQIIDVLVTATEAEP